MSNWAAKTYLEDDLDALTRRHQQSGGNSREETSKGKLGDGEILGGAGGSSSIHNLLAHIVGPEGDGEDGGDSDQRSGHTTVQTAEAISLQGLLENVRGALVGAIGAGLDADLYYVEYD